MCLTLVVCIIDFVMKLFFMLYHFGFVCVCVYIMYMWQVPDYHNRHKKCIFWHKFYSVMHKVYLQAHAFCTLTIKAFDIWYVGFVRLVILCFNFNSASICMRMLYECTWNLFMFILFFCCFWCCCYNYFRNETLLSK